MALNRVWVAIVMLILSKGWWSTNGCWEQERIALLQLKHFFNDRSYLQDWVESEESSNCCLWERVECNATTSRVIHLNLDYTRVWDSKEWYLNASLFLPFEKLETLSLAENKLAYWVENEGFERLSSRLSSLRILDLSINSLNESIFSSLSQFSSLKSLYLGYNNFKGSFQNNGFNNLLSLNELEGVVRLPRLINLEFFDLSYNNFNNNILSFFGGFSSLKTLRIRGNQLKGSIKIKDVLCNLEELDISENEVEKFVVPRDKRCLSKLKVLHLDNIHTNKSILLQSLESFLSLRRLYLRDETIYIVNDHLADMEGLHLDFSFLEINFLQSLGVLKFFKNLFLRNSKLDGTLHAQDLPNFKNLESLYMDSTSPNNNFLQSIGKMNSLKVLSLYYSGLSGTLHARGLCELVRLQKLDISYNDLEGNLPECLANLTSLQSLDLSGNKFTGNIAMSPFQSLTSIQYLSLENNHFQIPISLAPFFNYSKLKHFNGHNNEIYAETESHSLAPKFQLNTILLSGHGHGGEIPKFLYHQHDLQKVDLSHIHFGGEFPIWLLENNTGLDLLYLVNNSLSGPFQMPSFSHTNLSRLDISNNFLHGEIPTNVGAHMPRLEFLNMSENGFDGSIPSSFGYMNSLEVLDLSNNHLSGGIPEHLATSCFSLQELILSNNSLKGQIFSGNFNLLNLWQLHLNGNNFTGRIPNSLSNCSSLEVLDISNNHLSGGIPRWMGNMTDLKGITLPNNHLEGPIPVEFCQLNNLGVLDLSENYISGRIPSCFSPSGINHVHLSKNMLQGPLTDAFYNSFDMVTLDLSNNHLTGSIPNWIHRLFQLSYLLLNNNDLEGQVPIQLCQLKQLSLIDLSQNNILGHIPYCLYVTTREEVSAYPNSNSNAPAPTPILLLPLAPSISTEEPVDFTTKSISYPYQGRILTYMSGIDLSCNKLTGEIPQEIGNLNKIRVLNLSHNNLSGPIPPTFVNLKQIESLDLSNNNLSGKIPPEFVELYFLAVFSVAHNNLSGKTPEWTAQFATFEASSYEGNPLLCGQPLPKSCTASGSTSSMPRALIQNGEDSGFIDMDSFYVTFSVSYIIVLLGIAIVLYINPYWRRAWFYMIEMCITSCYYFVEDNLPKRCCH